MARLIFDWPAVLSAKRIGTSTTRNRVVGVGPTDDGYLRVSVMGDVPTQATLDAMFGDNVAPVDYGEPLRALTFP